MRTVVIFWLIFAIVEVEFLNSQHARSIQLLRQGSHGPSDPCKPTNLRTCCVSSWFQSGQWHSVRPTIQICMSGLPLLKEAKEHLPHQWGSQGERQFIQAIREYIAAQTQPISKTTRYNFDLNISDSEDEGGLMTTVRRISFETSASFLSCIDQVFRSLNFVPCPKVCLKPSKRVGLAVASYHHAGPLLFILH